MLRGRTKLAVVSLACLSLVSLLRGQTAPLPNVSLEGKVIAVADGDTLTVLVNQVQHRVRLQGIDAPEDGQDHSAQSKRFLSTRVFAKQVRVEVLGQDQYGRQLGTIWLGGEDVNLAIVSNGWAWHYKEFSDDAALAEAEVAARAAKRGLWAHDNAIAPWDYRALARKAAAERKNPTPREQQKFWLNTSSSTRHNSSCRYFNNTKNGRFCGPNDGKACGICGG